MSMRFCFPCFILAKTSNVRNKGPQIKKCYFFVNYHPIFFREMDCAGGKTKSVTLIFKILGPESEISYSFVI